MTNFGRGCPKDHLYLITLKSDQKVLNLGGLSEAKIKLFWNMVMLHIKLKLTTHAAKWWQIFCPQTHPRPQRRGQNVKP